jgi:hypothetical protein
MGKHGRGLPLAFAVIAILYSTDVGARAQAASNGTLEKPPSNVPKPGEGTSAATPIVAAIANLGGRFADSSVAELTHSYNHGAQFNKILTAPCGPGGVYSSTSGWSYCTGLGSPNGTGGL